MHYKNTVFKFIKEYYYIIIFIVIILLAGVYFIYDYLTTPKEVTTVDSVIERKLPNKSKEKVVIDIKGSVNKPGVYILNLGSNVNDAIKASGGLLDTADTTYINLSKQLQDEMVIIIYSKEQIQKMQAGVSNVVVVNGECKCPSVTNDGCILKEKTVSNKKPVIPIEENKRIVNLNTATYEDLLTLTGIGESKANAILSYRKQVGAFKKIDELKEVKGIGDAIFEKIKDRLSI